MIPAGRALHFGCYDYNENWLLIEMLVDVSWKWIMWHKFQVPQEDVSPENWQAPYLEQYLNDAGTEKICELYCEPEENIAPCRFTFFLYKTDATQLVCPFGQFDLINPQCVPERLMEIIEFELEDDEID